MKICFLIFAFLLILLISDKSYSKDQVYIYKNDEGDIYLHKKKESIPRRYQSKIKALALVTVSEKVNINQAEKPGSAVTLPLKDLNGLPVTEAVFNDYVKRDILLDTGSKLSFISSKLAVALGFGRSEKHQFLFSFPGFKKPKLAEKVILKKVSLGKGIVIRNLEAGIIDHRMRKDYSAVLGVNGLGMYDISIDMTKLKATFR